MATGIPCLELAMDHRNHSLARRFGMPVGKLEHWLLCDCLGSQFVGILPLVIGMLDSQK